MPRLNNHLGTGPGAWLQRSAAVSLVCAAAACGASAAEETSGSKQAAAEPVVLAEVDGQAIYLGEVNRGLAAVAQRRREIQRRQYLRQERVSLRAGDDELRLEYETRIAEFTTPERRRFIAANVASRSTNAWRRAIRILASCFQTHRCTICSWRD